MENDNKTVLVLGANGKTGSRVMQKLMALHVAVRAGSRSASPRFDWDDKSTWNAALENIESVYVCFQPDLAVPGADQIVQEFCDLARNSGVKKLVLLSGRGEKEAEVCEEIVKNSGLSWTIARASWFNQNFSESFLLEPIMDGFVALPVGNVKEPFIDVDDIADVVVAALTEEGHEGKLYELTGPRLISFQEAIQEIATATGRNIQYMNITLEAYTKYMEDAQIPQDYIALISYLFTEVLDGRNESATNGMEEALGRKAKDFSDYVREAAESGIWNAAQSV